MKTHQLSSELVLKKTLCFGLIVVCCVALCGSICFAKKSSLQEPIPIDLQRVIDRYDLGVVADAPPGVTPLAVDSASELEAVLSEIDAPRLTRPFELSPEIGGMFLESGLTCLYYHWRTTGFYPYQYNLAANVYVQNYGSFTWIDHISSVRFYLSGIVLGAYLKDIWTDSAIDPSNAQRATVSGGATECWYVMIKEVLTYYQKAVYMYRVVDIVQ